MTSIVSFPPPCGPPTSKLPLHALSGQRLAWSHLAQCNPNTAHRLAFPHLPAARCFACAQGCLLCTPTLAQLSSALPKQPCDLGDGASTCCRPDAVDWAVLGWETGCMPCPLSPRPDPHSTPACPRSSRLSPQLHLVMAHLLFSPSANTTRPSLLLRCSQRACMKHGHDANLPPPALSRPLL
jgi:hypothetical protein